jgi:predicted transcriptional regulator YdeE
MSVIHVDEKTIFGLVARTNNENEMNPQLGKIAGLVEKFDTSVSVNYRSGARVYTIYSEYETDASGNYSVLVGADKVESSTVELESVKIQEGNYLVFSGQGQVPDIVFETWSKIWSYFKNENCPHTRAYSTDFEFYKSQNEIEIHIAVK